MSATGRTIGTSNNVQNPYIRAFQREFGSKGILGHGFGNVFEDVFAHLVTGTWTLTEYQRSKLLRAQHHASAISLACSNSLVVGTMEFVSNNTPTIGNLVDYSQKVWTCLPEKRINLPHLVSITQASLQA
jgi:hypothetical protein